jgi:hypothetical protein
MTTLYSYSYFDIHIYQYTMAPKLRVVISSSSSAYPPHQPIDVNSPKPTPLETSSFKGEISVWIKGYEGDHKGGEGDEYFGQEGREGMTYAIVIRGMASLHLYVHLHIAIWNARLGEVD